MSKRANPANIGAFVVGAFLILFGALFYLSGNVFNRDTERVTVIHDVS